MLLVLSHEKGALMLPKAHIVAVDATLVGEKDLVMRIAMCSGVVYEVKGPATRIGKIREAFKDVAVETKTTVESVKLV